LSECFCSNKDLLGYISEQFSKHLNDPQINDGLFNTDLLNTKLNQFDIIKYEDLSDYNFNQLANRH